MLKKFTSLTILAICFLLIDVTVVSASPTVDSVFSIDDSAFSSSVCEKTLKSGFEKLESKYEELLEDNGIELKNLALVDSLFEQTENSCPNKCSPLDTRSEHEKCPCTIAISEFKDKVKGLIIYAQDECGSTTVIGFFSKGFDPNHKYSFLITDDRGKVLRNFTDDIHLSFIDGGIRPFKAKLDDVNLDCDEYGILFAKTPKPRDYHSTASKRDDYEKTFASKYRKRNNYAMTQIYKDGSSYDKADILKI